MLACSTQGPLRLLASTDSLLLMKMLSPSAAAASWLPSADVAIAAQRRAPERFCSVQVLPASCGRGSADSACTAGSVHEQALWHSAHMQHMHRCCLPQARSPCWCRQRRRLPLPPACGRRMSSSLRSTRGGQRPSWGSGGRPAGHRCGCSRCTRPPPGCSRRPTAHLPREAASGRVGEVLTHSHAQQLQHCRCSPQLQLRPWPTVSQPSPRAMLT